MMYRNVIKFMLRCGKFPAVPLSQSTQFGYCVAHEDYTD
jgi:hypothetical protein